MTAVTKPLSREYPPSRTGSRPLIVTLHPGGLIELREKRIGRSYAIGVHDLFSRLILEQKKGRFRVRMNALSEYFPKGGRT